MADTAFMTQYRSEFIAGFEQRTSDLRLACTTDVVIKGNTATFPIADSAGSVPVTRGTNGKIPSRSESIVQVSATLVEKHDLVERTGFNLFASQGDGRRMMQENSMGVINRGIDLDILGELANATNNLGAATTMNLAVVTRALNKLALNQVPVNEVDNMFAVMPPAVNGYLLQIKEFNSKDWVEIKPLDGGPIRKMLRWAGFNWIFSPLVTGIGTAAELGYFYHKAAIGHAVNKGEIMAQADYDTKQDSSWARTSIYMGSKILQNKGIVKFTHDGSLAYT